MAQHKADIAASNARIKNLENLQRISDAMAEMQNQQPGMSQAGEPTPATGSLQSPNNIQPLINNNLVQQLMQAQTQMGDLNPLLSMATKQYEIQTDPKRIMLQNYMSNTGTAGPDKLSSLIDMAANGDSKALADLATLKEITGVDLSNMIERKQSSMRAYPRELGVDKEGNIVTGMFNTITHQLIPGTERSGGSRVNMQTVVTPGGGEAAVPFYGGRPIGEGVQTKLPPSMMPIPAADLELWKNDKGESPNKLDTPQNLYAQGYKPISKLSGELSARFAKSVNSVDQLPTLNAWLFDDQGNIDISKFTKLKTGVGEGAKMKGILLQASEAGIRNMSGATVPEYEIKRQASEYVTGLLGLSSSESVKDGINRLYQDLDGFNNTVDPNGVYAKIVRTKRKRIPELKLNNSPTNAQSATGTYSDPEKEKRYQEWKKKQMGGK
jgi:hypothetical protein